MLRWFGHLKRMNDSRVTERMYGVISPSIQKFSTTGAIIALTLVYKEGHVNLGSFFDLNNIGGCAARASKSVPNSAEGCRQTKRTDVSQMSVSRCGRRCRAEPWRLRLTVFVRDRLRHKKLHAVGQLEMLSPELRLAQLETEFDPKHFCNEFSFGNLNNTRYRAHFMQHLPTSGDGVELNAQFSSQQHRIPVAGRVRLYHGAVTCDNATAAPAGDARSITFDSLTR
ncbi:hypothetical protein EVAR_69340_1 [Eumeta japonica]|uniref:Uncharacterized protein n=1 Tax=Eumeta variegata TaxID=151549 RepID=A0A4C2A5J1_EUMVA|nr:hypothetical protein EVAR_69340_1 [Eumeta japonica]